MDKFLIDLKYIFFWIYTVLVPLYIKNIVIIVHEIEPAQNYQQNTINVFQNE